MNRTIDSWIVGLKFESDWHVGDGAGQHGLIDRIVRRDPHDRLPFVPAKTVTGIWRDACERVARGLDNGEPGRWSAWVEALFGDEPALRKQTGGNPGERPRPALLSVRPARLPDGLRALLATSPQLRGALTLVKPGVKIDRRSGQALTDCLRFDEVVRAGAHLQTNVTLELPAAELREIALALLWAGAHTVERLGGKRRRGSGRCIWELKAIDRARALDLLASEPPEPPVPAREHSGRSFSNVGACASMATPSGWYRVPLLLQPRTPLVIPRAVVGNVVESHDFVPGTHLLGAVTRRLAALGIDPFPWVAAGALRVCHAYPEVQESEPVRGRPVPMVLACPKEDGGLEKSGGKVRNRLVVETDTGEDGAQWKPHRAGYLGMLHGEWLPAFEKPSLMLTTHATIEGEAQRPTEAVGGAYSYRAIHPGNLLRSEIWLTANLAERLAERRADWWRTLSGEVRLGLARKDDYGLVELIPEELEEIGGTATADTAAVDSLRVWLLSDLLSRDELLQPATTLAALQRELERNLPTGTGLKLASPITGTLSHLLRTRRSDGWHQGWGLPRPSYVGIAAGSCAVFDVAKGHLTGADLQSLAHQGLGERRGEGFGEVAVNDPLLGAELARRKARPGPDRVRGCCPMTDPQKPGDSPTALAASSGPVADYLDGLRCTALRERLRAAARIRAANTKFRREDLHWGLRSPGNSQLGNFRQVLGRLRGPESLGAEAVLGWINHVQQGRRWPREALGAVERVIRMPELIWDWLEIVDNPAKESVFAGLSAGEIAALKSDFRAEAVRTLFAASIHAEVRSREWNSEDRTEEQQ